MNNEILNVDHLLNPEKFFLAGATLDNVIFGFSQNQLKVLLLQSKSNKNWNLPGGFIYKDEELDEAAARILKSRTGLNDLFLQQFHVFGSTKRNRKDVLKDTLKIVGIEITENSWLMQRFITIGYYALVNYEKVEPKPDEVSLACVWHNLNNLPELNFDHKNIIQKALEAIRLQLNYQPIGYNLLPKEFTLRNLQSIYETILGRQLDRSNFKRKVMLYEILEKKEKHFTGASHKAPYLYSFNEEKYFKALENGLKKDF